jgi:hypothetical protein
VLRPKMLVQERHELIAEHRATRHPLVVAATRMVVRTVQPAARHAVHEPLEQRLVVSVHPERDLGLAPVTAEMPLPDQDSDQESGVERVETAMAIPNEIPPRVLALGRHADGTLPCIAGVLLWGGH